MQRRKFLLWGGAGIGTLGLALVAGWWRVDGPGAPTSVDQRPMALSDMAFRLTDHRGNMVGPETLIGRPSMVFFGFTYCPDVCPTTLSDITSWLDGMGEAADRLNTVFITVDPARDALDAMAEYIGYFHPTVRGWTGQPEEIARAAEGFRVTYERVPTDSGDYTMNHTASVFLFDAAGRYVTNVDYHESRETALPKIRRAMGE